MKNENYMNYDLLIDKISELEKRIKLNNDNLQKQINEIKKHLTTTK